jgi:hypothetical protein
MSKHTPGPWFADSGGKIWRRDPSELYQNGGGVAGDEPLAWTYEGWSDEGLQGYPVEANARLIAAAPDLLEALEFMLSVFNETYPDVADDEEDREAWAKARAAIRKATGE